MIKPVKEIAVTFLLMFCCTGLTAQTGSAALVKFIGDESNLTHAAVKHGAALKEFYSINSFKPGWINDENISNREELVALLSNAAVQGLSKNDYQFNFIAAFKAGKIKLPAEKDSLEAEIKFTDAAIHFFMDVAYGNKTPALGYDGLKFLPGCYNIPQLVASAAGEGKLSALVPILSTGIPEINIICSKIQWMLTIMAEKDFAETVVLDKKINSNNRLLFLKLYQLGIIDSAYEKKDEFFLKEKIKTAQRLFSLMDDAVIRSTLLQELNVPLSARLRLLNAAVNNYRWLNCLAKNSKVITVNIPAAFLKVYEGSSVILEMKLIVGKPSTPTPTLLSSVNEVVLYPYWHVPYSIATKELLPFIKRSRSFLENGNYQVLNLKGRVVDPYSINWGRLGKKYFPYIIRQSTGCDNSLGLLKLNFYSPFGVYLHDTPSSALFKMNKRYFSHGCMRMEKPFELGHLVLKNNAIAIDTLEEKGCLLNQQPVIVPANEKIPVLVWYNTAGIDAEGKLVFYEDVYKKFQEKK